MTIAISPTSAMVNTGATKQFSATVTGTTNTAVNWQVNNVAGGNTPVGTISPAGLYTAPAAVPSPAMVTVTAVSQADASKSSSASVTVASGISVTITPASITLGLGANTQFSAAVTGSTNTAVIWQVNGVAGGNVTVGTIDSTGLYIGPGALPTPVAVNVTAVAQVDSTTTSTPSPVTLSATDPLGSVTTHATLTCPGGGVSGATCYTLNVSCPGVADLTTYLKVNTPIGTPTGTVLFGIGTGGSGLYDSEFKSGKTAVENVLAGGYTTVQVTFGSPFSTAVPSGWLTGPGGVRHLACRYATTAQWIYANIHNSNAGAPMCGTGNSGGSAAISYALARFGLDSIFSMVEPTSGPPMARIDFGCICNQPDANTSCGQGNLSLCYQGSSSILDDAYNSTICTDAVKSRSTANQPLFLSDSILAPGAKLSYPKTDVHFLFGGLDNTSAVPLGLLYFNSITSTTSQACVADAPHPLPDVLDGATTVASDIIARCHLQ